MTQFCAVLRVLPIIGLIVSPVGVSDEAAVRPRKLALSLESETPKVTRVITFPQLAACVRTDHEQCCDWMKSPFIDVCTLAIGIFMLQGRYVTMIVNAVRD